MLLSRLITIFLALSIITAIGTMIAAMNRNDRLITVSAYFSTAGVTPKTPKSIRTAAIVPRSASTLGRMIQASFSACTVFVLVRSVYVTPDFVMPSSFLRSLSSMLPFP